MGFDESHRNSELHVAEGPLRAPANRRGASGTRAAKRHIIRHEQPAAHGYAAEHLPRGQFQPPVWLRRLALQLKLQPGQLVGIASAVVLLMALSWSFITRYDAAHDPMNLHADPSIIAGDQSPYRPSDPPTTDDFERTGLHGAANPWPTHLPKTASDVVKDSMHAGGEILDRSIHAVEHAWDRATDGLRHASDDVAGVGEGIAHRARGTVEHVKGFGLERMTGTPLSQKAQGAFEGAKEAVEGMAGDLGHEVSRNAHNAWDEARHIASDLSHRAHDTAERLTGTPLTERVRGAYDEAKDSMQDATGNVRDGVEHAWNDARDAADDLRDQVRHAVHPHAQPKSFFTTIKHKIFGEPEPQTTIDKVKQKAGDAWDQASNGVRSAANDIRERGEELARRAHDHAEHVKDFGIERMH